MNKLYEELKIQRVKHFARLQRSSVEFMNAYDRASKAVIEGELASDAITRLCPFDTHYSQDQEQGTVAGALQAARLVRLQKEGNL